MPTINPTTHLFVKGKQQGYTDHLFEKFILAVIKEYCDMDQSYSPVNIFGLIRQAVEKWPNFNYAGAIKVIKKLKEKNTDKNPFIRNEIFSMLVSSMPSWANTIKGASQINSLMKSSASKLPNKKLKLENCIYKNNLVKNLRDKIIYG
jgi:hypothetical protein